MLNWGSFLSFWIEKENLWKKLLNSYLLLNSPNGHRRYHGQTQGIMDKQNLDKSQTGLEWTNNKDMGKIYCPTNI